MKKLMNNSIALVSMITILFFSCSKENPSPEEEHEPEPEQTEEPNKVSEPTFMVEAYSVEQVTNDQGDPVYQVLFELTGEADNISLWSGSFGNDYQYREGGDSRIVNYDELNLSFLSRYGNNAGTRDNELSVRVSTDFDGVYDLGNVSNATWAEIEGFSFPTGATTSNMTESGEKDISEHREGGKPLYIAFKYTYSPPFLDGSARLWRVNGVKLEGVIGSETSTIMNTEGMNQDAMKSIWTFVQNGTGAPTRSTIDGSGFIMLANGNNTTATEGDPMEAWAIAKAFDAEDNNDKPIFIKRIVDPQLTTYQHSYAEPGTYEVVFIATNIDGEGTKEVIKTIEITITP